MGRTGGHGEAAAESCGGSAGPTGGETGALSSGDTGWPRRRDGISEIQGEAVPAIRRWRSPGVGRARRRWGLGRKASEQEAGKAASGRRSGGGEGGVRPASRRHGIRVGDWLVQVLLLRD